MATFKRVPNVPNSPASFAIFTKPIDRASRRPIRTRSLIKTALPHPLLPSDMAGVQIISRSAADATTDDFNAGSAMIGTGPYKFVEYGPATAWC